MCAAKQRKTTPSVRVNGTAQHGPVVDLWFVFFWGRTSSTLQKAQDNVDQNYRVKNALCQLPCHLRHCDSNSYCLGTTPEPATVICLLLCQLCAIEGVCFWNNKDISMQQSFNCKMSMDRDPLRSQLLKFFHTKCKPFHTKWKPSSDLKVISLSVNLRERVRKCSSAG